jgi:ribosomal protein S18 acetylase RimI-like enzyme
MPNQWDPTKLDVRVMRREDLEAIVAIDASVFGTERREYYESKIASALDPSRTLITSLVATYEGKPVGFLMGELYHGEFGIPASSATIDTIGVKPEFQKCGIATRLIEEFFSILKGARVERVHTLVRWDDWDLLRFFAKQGFTPGGSLYLEKGL